jgi:hypothetical protein
MPDAIIAICCTLYWRYPNEFLPDFSFPHTVREMRLWIVAKLRDKSLGTLSGRHPDDIERILQTNIHEEIVDAPDIGDEDYKDWRNTGLSIMELTEDDSTTASWFLFTFAEIVITAILRQGLKPDSVLSQLPAKPPATIIYEGTPEILHQTQPGFPC